MTLYEDGADFEHDSALVQLLIKLLEFDLYVCVVTAAGYPGDAKRYEGRLSGLLNGFRKAELPKDVCQKFFLLGMNSLSPCCHLQFPIKQTAYLYYL